ncbi:transcriptional regulator BetI [Marinivivus vitaminiproducens]|uniref:transcriptional regulator BetI n=1 Tax=Marinivivus vitaminiproducens TaxID=3035935 RepID=UPI00279A2F04|nr:transcriptional regulator BetI [Geminicoccaceae bacterium SCSIO 64248]
MPKVGMQPIRRRQLIDATIASISQHGLGDTTVQTISRNAGVSTGIIHHYFGGKDELLAATMRAMLESLRRDLVSRLDGIEDPHERLLAIIASNFAADQFDRPVITTWLAFWAEARHKPVLGRLQRIYARRLRSHIRRELRHLLPEADLTMATESLAAMIDGIWLTQALSGTADDRAARVLALRHLKSLLPQETRRHEAA